MSDTEPLAMREDTLLLNAYLDNELDAAAVLDIERRIASDPALRTEYDRLVALKAAVGQHLVKDRASAALRQRISAIAPGGTRGSIPRVPRTFDWRQMAAAAAIVCVLSSSTTYFALRPGAPTQVAELVAGHQRALLGAAPFDIASSDRHTVKPWFDSKLALSPQVVDLASDGFPLAGGRADIVNGKGVPTMVYRRRAHLISVVAVPEPQSVERLAPPVESSLDGYTVLSWNGKDFRYSAISDIAGEELKDFVARWRSAAQAK